MDAFEMHAILDKVELHFEDIMNQLRELVEILAGNRPTFPLDEIQYVRPPTGNPLPGVDWRGRMEP